MALDLKMLLFLTLVHEASGYEFRHIEVAVPYEDARNNCTLFGNTFDFVDETAVTKVFGDYIRKHNLTTAWLGVKKILLPHWIWINGRNVTSSMPDGGHSARSCAGISTVDRSLRAMGCNYGGDHDGVVCEHEIKCLHLTTKQCFEENEKSFTFWCGINNWYEARDTCRHFNGTIAILDTQKKIDKFVRAKMTVPSLVLCGFFWIGLIKEDWERTSTNKDRTITKTNWENEEPAVVGRCAIISRKHFKWNVVGCKERHTAVCASIPVPSTSTSLSRPPELKETGTNVHVTKGGLAAIVGTLITATLLLGIVIFFLMNQKKNKQRKAFRNNDHCLEEQHQLMENDESADAKDKTNISEIGQTTYDNGKIMNVIKSLISEHNRHVKLYVISIMDEIVYLRRMTVRPFDQQNRDTSAPDKQYEGHKQPLLVTSWDYTKILADNRVLYHQSFVDGCDILIVETTVDHVIELMCDLKTSPLKDTCILIPAELIRCPRMNNAILVGTTEMDKNTHVEALDVVISSLLINENLIFDSSKKSQVHNSATWYVAHVVALILIIAERHGLPYGRLQRLKQAEYLRKVFEGMMQPTDMGTALTAKLIHPWNILQELDYLKQVVKEALKTK